MTIAAGCPSCSGVRHFSAAVSLSIATRKALGPDAETMFGTWRIVPKRTALWVTSGVVRDTKPVSAVDPATRSPTLADQMVFPVAAVVSFLSQFVTLEPGDVIATGTPSGVGSATGTFLKPGDLVRATIAPIGTLENPVEAESE